MQLINRREMALLLLAALAAPAAAASAPFRAFRPGSFAELLAARRGEPFLLVLWSVTCAPCRREFELLRAMQDAHPRLPLVLVSTDDIGDSDVAARMLAEAGLEGVESWIFAGDPQRLRYEIDPAWYGEMPRAYFYDAGHRREGVSGSLAREQIERWLARTARG